MGRPAVEPHVENVLDLLVVGSVVVRPEEVLRVTVYQASAPSAANAAAMRSTTSGSRSAWPVCRFTNTAIGTPQARWRETHQSGLLSIIERMRLRPRSGTQRVASIAASAFSRRCQAPSIGMNHCAVARKISGAFDRQECG